MMVAPMQTSGADRPEWARLGFVPGQSLRIFGMRRSGNHAIINWLQRNAPGGKSLFLNNCKPGSNPLRNFRGIELNGEHAPQRKAEREMASIAGAAGDEALFLVSYEDTSPAEFSADRAVSGDFDEALFSRNVLIYRSFLNWSASLLKKMQPNPGYSLVRRNAILLRAVDTYSRLLRLVEQARDLHLTCIAYDRWYQDSAYRAGVLAGLGLPLMDNGLGRVQAYGGGSSFQKDASDASELNTGARWHEMANDPEFQAVLHLSARDQALMDPLSRLFPEDHAELVRISRRSHLSLLGGQA